MQGHFRLKYFFVAFLVVLLIIFFYFFNSKKEGVNLTPEGVFTPENYPSGTTVSLYKNAPPLFPEELILENRTLDYSGTVLIPGGGKQITVSYLSSKKIPELVEMYDNSLQQNGWTISTKVIHTKVGTISASKTIERMIITTALVRDKGTMVTFQYEK